MNIKILKEILNHFPEEAEIKITGCYSSQGDFLSSTSSEIEAIRINDETINKLTIYLHTDLCSG